MRVGRRFLTSLVCSIVLAGCGGHALAVGSTDGGGATDAEATLDVNPFADADPAAPEVWVGHFVDHQLPNGSDTLTMTVQLANDGTVKGTLLLGDGAVLAPPTDPNLGYPPYAVFNGVTAIEGFPYTIRDGTKTGSTLTFQVAEAEAWGQWCAIQTAYLEQSANDAGPSFYSCNPTLVGYEFGPTGCSSPDPVTMQVTPIDCDKLQLCMPGGPCQCTATGCSVDQANEANLGLALQLTGNAADGTTSGAFGSYPVHFTRTE